LILRYADLPFIVNYIIHKYTESTKREMWELYLTKYQHMDKKNYISFEEFYKPPKSQSTKTDAEVLEMAQRTIKRIKR